MDTTATHEAAPGPSAAAPEHPEVPPRSHDRLRRSRRRRLLGGVAGGISERFDVDVSLVRVAFVVLACAWGVGAVVYAAMWALVPARPLGEEPAGTEEEPSEATPSWLAFLLLAGVLAFGFLVISSWWGGPRWGGAIGLLWLVLLLGILAAVVTGPSRRVSFRRAVGFLLLGILSLVILAGGAFAGLVASTGVPLSGGVGERVYAPAALSQLQASYRLGVGDLTVDLRRLRFVPGAPPRRISASVAVGVVTVDVPAGVVVDVDAHSGIGNVVASSGSVGDFGFAGAGNPSRSPSLILTVQAGVGQVRLDRDVSI